ncbi:MAG: GNAT family N-acetyltransferase [Deltaproteobacteria bacterium]|nr:GNAT family N-acetyltransferase [Deltaproteobacteria bacterium]
MLKIEALADSHDRAGFECGSEPLNVYLQQTAKQRARRGISKTFVLVDEDALNPKPILGFFSLNLCQIKSVSLSSDQAKKLPRDVAGVRLGRLAVAKTCQKQGFGKTLLVAAMEKFLEIFNKAGGIGLFVDAKDQEAKRYYEQFGFVSLPSNELQLFLPVATIQDALTSKT